MKPYKFKSLKSYSSPEWMADSKKKYRQVFDRGETTYIYSELAFHNKQFDREDWEAIVHLKAFQKPVSLDRDPISVIPKELCNLDKKLTVSRDQDVIYVREGWGNNTPGKYWLEGEYFWEAFIDNEKIGRHDFFVSDVGVVSPQNNPYFSIETVKFYEGGNTDGNLENKKYYREFNGKETRFVWLEFRGINHVNKDWRAELIFQFYDSAHQLKGRTIEMKKVFPNQQTFTITSGWGSNHVGTWYPGSYTLEVVFMDTLIGVYPFTVGDNFIEDKSSPFPPMDWKL